MTAKPTARKRTVPRRRDARMDSDGHCTVCGCEVREYEGGTDAEAIKAHKCPPGFHVKLTARKRTGHPGLRTVAAKRLLAQVTAASRLVVQWCREAKRTFPCGGDIRRCADQLERILKP